MTARLVWASSTGRGLYKRPAVAYYSGGKWVALDGSGNVTAQQLYAPYGGARYTNGSMPTSRGFTGQHANATTG